MNALLAIVGLCVLIAVVIALLQTRRYEQATRAGHESFCEDVNRELADRQRYWADELDDVWRAV
ncbi:MAG TPA: hypothetical protein VFF79_12630 [Conexibacter sp.]|jgi:hypothetical protein|nr:hypothetical protein [Conexibacter sp.]